MQFFHVTFPGGFNVLGGSDRSQAATMILEPGESTGGPDNAHADSDQWVYVVSGEGYAIIVGRRHELRPGQLLLIEAKEPHEIGCVGTEPLSVISIYAPPEY